MKASTALFRDMLPSSTRINGLIVIRGYTSFQWQLRRKVGSGLAAPDGDFAQDGISPHFIGESRLAGSFGCWRITGMGWVGAIL